jgi:hypothetical protein
MHDFVPLPRDDFVNTVTLVVKATLGGSPLTHRW